MRRPGTLDRCGTQGSLALYRGHILPRWAGPALAIGWIIGGPVAPSGALFRIPAATCAVLAARLAAPDSLSAPTAA